MIIKKDVFYRDVVVEIPGEKNSHLRKLPGGYCLDENEVFALCRMEKWCKQKNQESQASVFDLVAKACKWAALVFAPKGCDIIGTRLFDAAEKITFASLENPDLLPGRLIGGRIKSLAQLSRRFEPSYPIMAKICQLTESDYVGMTQEDQSNLSVFCEEMRSRFDQWWNENESTLGLLDKHYRLLTEEERNQSQDQVQVEAASAPSLSFS
jgi:hypothetical protein